MSKKELMRKRQDILDEYFLKRARKQLKSTAEGCDWCDRFDELDFQVCLNCGKFYYGR